MIIVCQVCRQEIAGTGPDVLKVPMRGTMFHAHREGFPPPLGDVEWKHMKCRYCGKRPFEKEDEVLTTEGLYQIPEPAPTITDSGTISIKSDERLDPLVCKKCGKEYRHTEKGEIWYTKHIKKCNK